MEIIRLIGRSSRLSLLQLEIARKKIEATCPGKTVRIIARESRGDALHDVPLHTVEGSDFFTQDIFDALTKGEADIAVHSLKDMSTEHFLGANSFAIVDRDDARDVLIFNPHAASRIQTNGSMRIGTCSPRREEMATGFLKKALPQLADGFEVVTKEIRGNVDTRLRKLDNGEYDGIVLATAGLNRLLKSPKDAPAIKSFLKDKKFMLLPLIECVPAPCQGAIVAEAHSSNIKAVKILEEINDRQLMNSCMGEKKKAMQYGAGCLQKFGVTTISYANKTDGCDEVLYAAGKDSKGANFSAWTGLPDIGFAQKKIFSTTDFMGSFFDYDYDGHDLKIDEPIVYVANYKAVGSEAIISQLKKKRVWAAGTKTWFELAKKGIWVEGSADAFGLEFLEKAWEMPLIRIEKKDVAIVTSADGAEIWRSKGWKAHSTYSTKEKYSAAIELRLQEAEMIFWTSYRQYQQYKNVIRDSVIHLCSHGETAEQFRAAGIKPIVFPNIKAFQQWRQTSTHSRNDD